MKKLKKTMKVKNYFNKFWSFTKEHGVLAFWKNRTYILNENDLLEILKPTILNDVWGNSRESKSILKRCKDFLHCGIVYELMKNTFEWKMMN
jgi:hypothetical protein